MDLLIGAFILCLFEVLNYYWGDNPELTYLVGVGFGRGGRSEKGQGGDWEGGEE